jgi:hypothetical protein
MKFNSNILAVVITAFVLLSAFWHHDGLTPEMKWWMYDLSHALQITAVSFMLFWFMPVRLSVIKAVGLFWLLDSLKEIYDVVVNDNANDWAGLIIQHSLFFVACIIAYTRYELQEAIHSQHSHPKESGVYVVVSRHKGFRSFMYWVFGLTSGKVSMAFVNKEEGYADLYHFASHTGHYSRKIVEIDSLRDCAFIELNVTPEQFREAVSGQLGRYWTPMRNCGSVLTPALRKSGYRLHIAATLPSILIKSILRQNHYARSSSSKPKK